MKTIILLLMMASLCAGQDETRSLLSTLAVEKEIADVKATMDKAWEDADKARKAHGDQSAFNAIYDPAQAKCAQVIERLRATVPKLVLWMADQGYGLAFGRNATPWIYTRDEVEALIQKLPSERHDAIVLRSGVVVSIDHVLKIDEAGLSYVGDGILRAKFSELPASIVDAIGWSDDVAKTVKESIARQQTQAIVAASTPKPSGVNVASQQRTVGEVVAALARKEWPNDYEMQEFVRKKQLEAHIKLRKLEEDGADGVPASVLNRILYDAYQRWPEGDYDMIYFTSKRQVEAYRRLHP